MKKLFAIQFLLVLNVHFSFCQKTDTRDVYTILENPKIIQINQETGRNPYVPYLTLSDAIKDDVRYSHLFHSLNGKWKFNWSENYDLSEKEFFKVGYSDKSWSSIVVPGNWEMLGFGDPMFRNTQHPFVYDPPFVPKDYNPVGLYRKSFSMPQNWGGKEIFLNIEGASSASFIWVNGHQAGYNSGSFEPSEYDITKFLKPGENEISIQVFKYSAGTYLEDQDYWRLAGIFRDVYLVAMPKLHCKDVSIVTDLDTQYKDATINVTTEVKNDGSASGMQYKIQALLLKNGETKPQKIATSPLFSISNSASQTIKLDAKVANPEKWTAETPNLYKLIVELMDEKGGLIEVIPRKVGFRRIEVKHQAMLLNGVPIKLNGVNSHMQHPVTGRVMDVETMRKDLILMKQFNINCVRTSHYPPNKEYLDLADELGMYIVDEVGDESHATQYLSELDEWTDAYRKRAERTVLRDRSHPSIIFWSAGNESGFGKNICEVINTGKSLDKQRLWMYGGNTDDPAWANEVPCEEIIGPRYPTPAELEYRIAQVPENQDPRPSFMDEYVAATGNGLGGLDEYWNIIWKYPRCIGGAIWDWVSPGLKQKVRFLKDESPGNVVTSINGRGQLIKIGQRNALSLDGFDQWVDVYRDPGLDITGDKLTISAKLFPRDWNGNGSFLTKGSNQYGLIQRNKDSLEFYVGTEFRGSIVAAVPANWYHNWHSVTGIYDGNELRILVDGKILASKQKTGRIINRPFPVNIGRNAEIIGQEYTGRHSNAIFDFVAVFDKQIDPDSLENPPGNNKSKSRLWLNFDRVTDSGEYYSLGNDARSYGLVWPDRTPKPELWQVKKSAQPVLISAVDLNKGVFKITNRYRFTNLNDLKMNWQIIDKKKIVQEGLDDIALRPLDSLIVNIPVNLSQVKNNESRLLISFKTKSDKVWASAGFEVAWAEFSIPGKKAYQDSSEVVKSDLKVIENVNFISIKGVDFSYKFDRTSGKLVSLNYYDHEMINQGPILNVWRAPLANELDTWNASGAQLSYLPGMGNDIANAWRSLGLNKLTYKLDDISVSKDGHAVIVDVSSHTEGTSYKTVFEEHYTYQVANNGFITINHRINPQGIMPDWLQCMGNQWNLNEKLDQVSWFGRGPFENYPDRKSGAKTGVYETTVTGMQEKYLVPQDFGLRTETRWVRLTSAEGYGLEFSGNDFFDFSAHFFNDDLLARARYPFQLKRSAGVTFTFNHLTSGVGCTAISVLNQYKVMPQPISYQFTIRPYKNNTIEK